MIIFFSISLLQGQFWKFSKLFNIYLQKRKKLLHELSGRSLLKNMLGGSSNIYNFHKIKKNNGYGRQYRLKNTKLNICTSFLFNFYKFNFGKVWLQISLKKSLFGKKFLKFVYKTEKVFVVISRKKLIFINKHIPTFGTTCLNEIEIAE